MANYYNGHYLPDLPSVDLSVYPYVNIIQSVQVPSHYKLRFTSGKGKFEGDGIYCTDVDQILYELELENYDSWKYVNSYSGSNHVYLEYEEEAGGHNLVFHNYDILNEDGTVYRTTRGSVQDGNLWLYNLVGLPPLPSDAYKYGIIIHSNEGNLFGFISYNVPLVSVISESGNLYNDYVQLPQASEVRGKVYYLENGNWVFAEEITSTWDGSIVPLESWVMWANYVLPNHVDTIDDSYIYIPRLLTVFDKKYDSADYFDTRPVGILPWDMPYYNSEMGFSVYFSSDGTMYATDGTTKEVMFDGLYYRADTKTGEVYIYKKNSDGVLEYADMKVSADKKIFTWIYSTQLNLSYVFELQGEPPDTGGSDTGGDNTGGDNEGGNTGGGEVTVTFDTQAFLNGLICGLLGKGV